MVTCAVKFCKNSSNKKGIKVSYHRFPQDWRREIWIDAVGRSKFVPTKNSAVCSMHFNGCDFKYDKNLKILTKIAVPTMNLPPPVTATECPFEIAFVKDENLTDDEYFTEEESFTEEENNLSQQGCSSQADPLTLEKDFIKIEHEVIPLDLPIKEELVDENCKQEDVQMVCAPKKIKLIPLIMKQPKSKFQQSYRKTIVDVGEMIKELEKERMIDFDLSDFLLNTNVQNNELFNRLIEEHPTGEYSPALRAFAAALKFNSPKAYKFAQENFDVCLPDPTVIDLWCTSVQGRPGFTEEAFTALKQKASASLCPLVCNLVIGEMQIKEYLEVADQKYYGFINYGIDFDDDSVPYAKVALVFMVVCVNKCWSLPVAYFLLDYTISGEQKSTLITDCLNRIHQTNIKIVSITVDDNYLTPNIAMLKHLGCAMKNKNLQSSFKHPTSGEAIQIFFNPGHMLKMIQIAFESNRVLIDENNGRIDWSFIEKLQNFQKEKGLYKLKAHQRDFPQHQMNIKLASKLFSYNIANALEFCSQDLEMDEFKDSAPTIRFIRIINNFFDLLNSRQMYQYGYKKRLLESNVDQTFEFLDTVDNYLKKLKLSDGNFVLNSVHCKSGFLGFQINILSYKAICQKLFREYYLRYICFSKFSGDPIEHLFYNLSSQSNKGDFPTSRQFESAYKKMLIHMKEREFTKGPYIPLEQIAILNCSDSITKINQTDLKHHMSDYEDIFNEKEKPIQIDDALEPYVYSEYSHEIVTYIAGHVAHYLYTKIKCEDCLNVLYSTNTNLFRQKLSVLKSKSGFLPPSKDVVSVCVQAEKILKEAIIANGGLRLHKLNVLQLVIKTLKSSTYSNIFYCLYYHVFNQNVTENHKTELIRAVVKYYLVTRINSMTRI